MRRQISTKAYQRWRFCIRMLSMRYPLVLILGFLLTHSLHAGLIERHPLTNPASALTPARPDRVVADGNGMYLVQGQRISRDGINLNGEQIPGAEGYAVAWNDGWLLIDSSNGQLKIRHLHENGQLDPFSEIPAQGAFAGAASNNGHVVILESVDSTFPRTFWTTTLDSKGIVVQRRELARLGGAVIISFREGFAIASFVYEEPYPSAALHAWRLSEDGTPLEMQTIEHTRQPARLSAVSRSDEFVVVTEDTNSVTVRVVDSSLHARAPIQIPKNDRTFISARSVLPFPDVSARDAFLISYTLYPLGGGDQDRAAVFGSDGTLVSDAAADPIASGDLFGGRYLVVRPWGDAALADGDPQHVVSGTIKLRLRVYSAVNVRDTVVSGEVTLVLMGSSDQSQFIRLNAAGVAIDLGPTKAEPGLAVPTPRGFAFVSLAADEIRIRELSRAGGWIDDGPRLLTRAPGAVSIAARYNSDDLLVAWQAGNELLWATFALDGIPLQQAPFRVSIPAGLSLRLGVSGTGRDRLLVAQQNYVCQTLCIFPEIRAYVLAIGPEGLPLGTLQTFPSFRSSAVAAGLFDGTWALPLNNGGGEVFHLARDGSLLDRSQQPLLQNAILDLTPTAFGWKALVAGPERLVEFAGASSPIGLTGLSDSLTPRFGAGDLIVFQHPSPLLAKLDVPWVGRLFTIDGDLSLRVFRLSKIGYAQPYQIAVTNIGKTEVTNAYVAAEGTASPFGLPVRRLPPLLPGKKVLLFVDAGSIEGRLLALSDDITDRTPADNVVAFNDAVPLQSTHPRVTRR